MTRRWYIARYGKYWGVWSYDASVWKRPPKDAVPFTLDATVTQALRSVRKSIKQNAKRASDETS